MLYRRLAVAALLAAMPATVAFAQISFRVHGLHVNVPLHDREDRGRQCRLNRIYANNGRQRETVCLASDGRWYPEAQLYPQTADPGQARSYPSQGYAPSAAVSASANLSGEWRSQSGGVFDINQSGSHVVWSGHSEDGYTWQNRFEGDVSGNYLKGYFEDIATSRLHNSGPLTFRIEGARLIRVNATRAFSDTVLMRSDAYTAQNDGYRSGRQQYATVQQPPVPERVPSTPLDRKLDEIVKTDSRSWLSWHYDAGSMTSAKVLSKSGGAEVLGGDYTFNGGQSGSVKVKLVNGEISCLQFFNEPTCRALGHPPSHDLAAGVGRALIEDMFGGGGSDSDGGQSDPAGYHNWCANQGGNSMSGCP